MRNNIQPLTAILIIFAVLISSCSDNQAIRLRYDIEKSFFQAEKAFRLVRMKPKLAEASQYDQLRIMYGDILTQCYLALDSVDAAIHPEVVTELSDLTFRSATRLAQFNFADKKIDASITVLTDLLERVNISRDSRMNCYYNLGRALQANGQFDSALTIYEMATEKFQPPLTNDGELYSQIFNIPMQLHSVYQRLRDTARANLQYKLAEEYYQNLVGNDSLSNLLNSSHANLARLHAANNEWQEVINELSQVYDTSGQISTWANIQIADTYAAKLNKYKMAQNIYDTLALSLKGNDTLLHPVLLHKRAISLIRQGDYSAARRTLIDLDREFHAYFAWSAPAQYAKARTFELEENWERAVVEYKFLIEQYEGTSEAMSSYLYLAQQYKKRSRPKLAKQWYKNGLENYDLIARRRAGTTAQSIALLFKSEVYRQQQKWQEAIDILTDIYSQFSQSEPGQRALIGAASIYKNDLNQPQKADSLLEVLKKSLTEVDETSKI